MLDIFSNDAFSTRELTDAISTPPFMPGAAGLIVPWQETGVSVTLIGIEEVAGELALVDPSAYGAPGQTFVDPKRKMRPFAIPHYQIDDSVMAAEVQGVREFGTDSQLRTVATLLAQRMADRIQNKMDPTLEYQRLNALKGIIIDSASNPILNLFTGFEVSQEAETAFDLSNASPASGALRRKCAGVVRTIANNLAGVPFGGVVGSLCGDAFFDDLIAHPEVVLSYRNTSMAEVLRQGYLQPGGSKIYGAFEFGGIVWQNYRGAIGGTAMVNTDKCHLFPIGTPGLYRTYMAPADYMDTVNTPGQRRYAHQWPRADNKGVHLQLQMNTLNLVTRPKVLMLGKRGA